MTGFIRAPFTIIIAMCLVVIVGCVTTDQLAPPVDRIMLDLGDDPAIDAQTLERGRRVYLTRCASCHSPEPISGYSLERWPGIIESMKERSGIAQQEVDDLRAYVLTARRAVECGVAGS